MADLPLTMAIFDYDHVRDMSTGRVKPEGIDLTIINHDVEEIFHRFMFGQEWQVSEISMGMSTSRFSEGNAPFVYLPVFPSRVFRMSGIYVLRDGPIKTAADLKGKRIGVPEWGQTAGIYIRGWMVHQAGVKLTEVEWFQSGIDDPGRQEAANLDLPEGVKLNVVTDRSLTQKIFGDDFWPYGIEPNRVTLEAFLQFAYEQGTLHRRLTVDELYPDEVKHRFKY
jgi:4,5-dihydroxyphthalate decarboxylase